MGALSCVFMADENWRSNTMISTNQSTVSLWIWTNERSPPCLEATTAMMVPSTGWAENRAYWALNLKLWFALWPRLTLNLSKDPSSGGRSTHRSYHTGCWYSPFPWVSLNSWRVYLNINKTVASD